MNPIVSSSSQTQSGSDLVPPWSPDRTYPFKRTSNGDIKVQWTPSATTKWKDKTVVYQIKNLVNFKRYIGQTVNLFRRMSSRNSRAKTNPDSDFLLELRQKPEDFVVGAIETDSPDELESQLIEQKDTISEGYNQRNGGGGGAARSEPPISPATMKRAFQHLSESFESPMKFPLSKTKGSITHTTPQATQNQKGVVYLIQRKTPKGMWVYVGSTTRKFVRRLCEHLFHANHPYALRSKSSPMYPILHQYARQCTVSVIDNNVFPPGLPLSKKEQLVIDLYETRGYTLFNKNRGGGGGVSKK